MFTVRRLQIQIAYSEEETTNLRFEALMKTDGQGKEYKCSEWPSFHLILISSILEWLVSCTGKIYPFD